MNPVQFEDGLLRPLRRRPFQPFAIEFDDGERFTVPEPKALNYGGGQTALYFGSDDTRMFHCEAVRCIVEPATAGVAR